MNSKKRTALSSEQKKEAVKVPKETQKRLEGEADVRAHMSLRPTVQAALTLTEYNKGFGELSIKTLVDDLGKQCELASDGDLKRAEAILTAQAHTLDAIFHELARRAERAQHFSQFEAQLRLALKAQAQCRSTLEALITVKNPQPVAFVRQANIAHGPQQVNNGSAVTAHRSAESEPSQNELLEHPNGEGLDTRAARTSGGADSPLEAMGAVDRT